MVLQPASHGIEGITDRYIQVAMRMLRPWFLVHHDRPTRNRQIDAHVIGTAAPLMTVGNFHHDATGGDSITELLQFGRAAFNQRLSDRRPVKVTK